MTYTAAAVLGVLFTVALDVAILRTRVLTRKAFWVAYAIIVTFQLITNGVLTGSSIVLYSGDDIIGSDHVQFFGDGRLAFAPIEDLFFGFALVTQSLVWWVWWGRRGVQYEPVAGPPGWRRSISRRSQRSAD